jgi:hypothetical protein
VESIAPLQNCIIYLIFLLEGGNSLNKSIDIYIKEFDDDVALGVREWLFIRGQGLEVDDFVNQQKNLHRKALFKLLDKGFKGQSVLGFLKNLEQEVECAVKSEISKFISYLPLKMMVPVFFLQFPAYLILLLGPILTDLIKGVSL